MAPGARHTEDRRIYAALRRADQRGSRLERGSNWLGSGNEGEEANVSVTVNHAATGRGGSAAGSSRPRQVELVRWCASWCELRDRRHDAEVSEDRRGDVGV